MANNEDNARIIKEQNELISFLLKENTELKESAKRVKENLRKTILSNISTDKSTYLVTFEALEQYLLPFDLNSLTFGQDAKVVDRYRLRKVDRISTAPTTEPSSVGGENNMSTFRFRRMFYDVDRQIKKIAFPADALKDLIKSNLFGNNQAAYDHYIRCALAKLSVLRDVYECHHHYQPEISSSSPVPELMMFQPPFQCFLRSIVQLAQAHLHNITTSSSSFSSPSPPQVSLFDVRAGQTEKLSFTAVLFADEHQTGVTETINGFSDIIISKNIQANTRESILCLVELKSPIVLSKGNNIEAPKNQICAQLKGLANYNGDECLTIPKVCLTDLFSIYSSFLLDGVFYISESAYEPEEYIVYLTFQLCDITRGEFLDLVNASSLEDDKEILEEGLDVKPHVGRLPIDYKFMEACETYQDEVLHMIRWQDEYWGSGHLNKENLDTLTQQQNENVPTGNLVLARFLGDK